MVDFKIKGTKLPVIPAGFEFMFKYSNGFMGYANVKGSTRTLSSLMDKHFSHGSITYKNEVYILAEYESYDGDWFFIYKESDIIKLAKEQGMIEEEFKLPEKWCVKDCREVSLWASKSFGCGVGVSSKYLCVNQKYFPHKSSYSFTENKDYYTEITFEQFKKYVLKENNNMENKEIIGYKLNGVVSKEIADRVLKWQSSDYDGLYFIKGHLGGSLVAEAKRLDILDKWFEPVYKTKEKTVSVGGKFDVVIKNGKIWHKNDDITNFVEELVKVNDFSVIENSKTYGKFPAMIIDIVFSKTGCQNVETKLSDWKQVYETYKNMQ